MKAISAKERYAEYLKSCGSTITSEEARVIDIAWDMHGEFSDEEVVSKADEEVPFVIVLRTIARLIRAGLLRRVAPDSQSKLVTTWPQ